MYTVSVGVSFCFDSQFFFLFLKWFWFRANQLELVTTNRPVRCECVYIYIYIYNTWASEYGSWCFRFHFRNPQMLKWWRIGEFSPQFRRYEHCSSCGLMLNELKEVRESNTHTHDVLFSVWEQKDKFLWKCAGLCCYQNSVKHYVKSRAWMSRKIREFPVCAVKLHDTQKTNTALLL